MEDPSGSQADPLQSQLQGMYESAIAFASSLARDKTPLRTRKILDKVFRLEQSIANQTFDEIDSMPPDQRLKYAPKCRAGCDFCCYQWVRVTGLEVIAVAEYVRENFSPDQFDNLLEKAREYRAEFLKRERGSLFSLPCPLLSNSMCSVYEARPIVCRGLVSLSAELCRLGRDAPESGVNIPYLDPLIRASSALCQGVAEGMARADLPNCGFVLGLALLVALEDPGAGEKFLAGENVFAGCEASLFEVHRGK